MDAASIDRLVAAVDRLSDEMARLRQAIGGAQWSAWDAERGAVEAAETLPPWGLGPDVPTIAEDQQRTPKQDAASRTNVQKATDTRIAAREAAGMPRLWSPERGAVLREHYPAGMLMDEILVLLNALPGPKIAVAQAGPRASGKPGRGGLGLSRPPGFMGLIARARRGAPAAAEPAGGDQHAPPATQPVAAPATVSPRPAAAPPKPRPPASGAFAKAMAMPREAPDTTTPIVTDFETIRDVAGRWGIAFNSRADLAEVNEKAARIGHRPFALEQRGAA